MIEIGILRRRRIQVVVVEIDNDLVSSLRYRRTNSLYRLRYDGQDLGTQVQLKLSREIFTTVEDFTTHIAQRSGGRPVDINPITIVRKRLSKTHDHFVRRFTQTQEARSDHDIVRRVQNAIGTSAGQLNRTQSIGVDDRVFIEAERQIGGRNVTQVAIVQQRTVVRLNADQLRARGEQQTIFKSLQL